MNQQTAVLEEVSERTGEDREPARDKGIGAWEAFTAPSPEARLLQMIDDLPNEGQIEMLVERLREPYLRQFATGLLKIDVAVAKNPKSYRLFFVQELSSCISAAENYVGPNVRSLKEVFSELANRWHEETDYLSSPSRITGNDTYLEIISLGEGVIPFILQDLRDRGGDWYRALRILSGTNPVPVEARGDVPQMKDSWLRWGRDNGYIK